MTKNRYLELKYFCLQYSDYKRKIREYESGKIPGRSFSEIKSKDILDLTAECAVSAAFYKDKTDAIEYAAKACDRDIGSYILIAVTRGFSFPKMKTQYDLPCERDMYYDRRRRFFDILDAELSLNLHHL